jgi:hypothetical protein
MSFKGIFETLSSLTNKKAKSKKEFRMGEMNPVDPEILDLMDNEKTFYDRIERLMQDDKIQPKRKEPIYYWDENGELRVEEPQDEFIFNT